MFHHFHGLNVKKTGQGSITIKQFEKIIKYLNHNFEILEPSEWLNRSNNNNLKSQQICLTFDDSLFSQYQIALKILNKYNLKAFWFIYSSVFNGELDNFEIYRKFRVCYFKNFDDFFNEFKINYNKFNFKKINRAEYVEKIKKIKKSYPVYSYNDILFRIIRDEILDKEEFEAIMNQMINNKKTSYKKISEKLWMKNYHLVKLSNEKHEIGMHSYNHPYKLGTLSFEEQNNELMKNFKHIKKCTNKKPFSISYPNGSYDNNTIKILKKLKIKVGFCSTMNILSKNKQNKLFFPRLDHSQILNSI